MKRFTILILVFMLVIISITGCGNYKRDTSSGSVVETRLDDIIKMVENKETFVVNFSRSTCKDCIKFNKILEPYLEDHNLNIKEVVLDNEGTSDEEIQSNRKKINSVFPDFNATPSTYYVKDGEIVDEIVEAKTEVELDEWVLKNKLDKK